MPRCHIAWYVSYLYTWLTSPTRAPRSAVLAPYVHTSRDQLAYLTGTENLLVYLSELSQCSPPYSAKSGTVLHVKPLKGMLIPSVRARCSQTVSLPGASKHPGSQRAASQPLCQTFLRKVVSTYTCHLPFRIHQPRRRIIPMWKCRQDRTSLDAELQPQLRVHSILWTPMMKTRFRLWLK